jgi:hypothetical protein
LARRSHTMMIESLIARAMVGAAVAATLTACAADEPTTCADAARVFAGHRDGGGIGSGFPASSPQAARDADDWNDARFRDAPGIVGEAGRFRGDARLGRLRWFASHRTVAPGALSPVTDGVVTIGAPTRNVELDRGKEAAPTDYRIGVLRAKDGRRLWSRSGEPGGTVAPIQIAGTKELTAGFDVHTGRLRWCTAGGARLDPDSIVPAAGGTAVVADAGADSVVRIRLTDGARLWSAKAQYERREMSTPDFFTRLAVGGGVVAAGTVGNLSGSYGSELGVYRLADGKRLWRLYDPNSDDVDDPARASAYTRQLLGVVDGGLVAVERHSGPPMSVRLTVYDAVSGRHRWTRPITYNSSEKQQFRIAGSLVLAEMDVPAPDEVGHITAWRVTDGAKAWTLPYDYAENPDLTIGVAAGRHLYTHGNGGLTVIDLERGAMHTPLPLSSAPVSSMAVGDGVLIVQSTNLLMAFDLPRKER